MSTKAAYVWGPISNFAANLLASMLENGWTIHLACKSALQMTLSPLDLPSTAQHSIEKAASSPEKFKLCSDRLLFLENDEVHKGTTYDVILFMGLPSNYDEPRVSRAPWAAEQLSTINAKLKGVPIIIFSSLSGGIQNDGVVPEEIEFERRKPRSHFEGVCQQYEAKVLKAINKIDAKWHLVRIPLVLGNSTDGRSLNFTGLYNLLKELYLAKLALGDNPENKSIELAYDPNMTCWMLPVDFATNLATRIIEDPLRPVICNVVSTRSTLSQEWMNDLSVGLGVQSIAPVERDNLNLPTTLRVILSDHLNIKTRNLFELLGRHQQAPMNLSNDYFHNVIEYACNNNWGQQQAPVPEPGFSAQKAHEYFEEFLPTHLDKKMLKALASFSGGLAFQVSGEDGCQWLLQSQDGKAIVNTFNPDSHKPQAVFHLNPVTFGKLSSGRLFFEQALLTRAVQVSGNPISSLKACDFFRRFLRHHHFAVNGNEKVLEGAMSD